MASAQGLVAVALLGSCAFDPSGLTGSVPDADPGTLDGMIGAADAMLDAMDPDANLPPPPCPTDPDLVACYRFENDVTPIQPSDDTIYSNDGTSTAVTYIAGRPGRGLAMQFSGASSTLIPDSPSLDISATITLEAWIRVTAYPAAATRMGILDDNGQYGLFLLPGGQVRCSIQPGFSDALTIALSTWTHIACVYDGASMTQYENGVAATPVAMSGVISTAGVDGLGLGQNLPTGEHLAGALDDVRIWRVPLTPTEVCASAGCP